MDAIITFFLKKTKFLLKRIKVLFLFLLTSPFALILWALNIQILKVNITRIGHFVGDLDSFMALHPPKKNYVVICPINRVANSEIIRYLPNEIYFITNKVLSMVLSQLLVNPICTVSLAKFSESHSESYVIKAQRKKKTYKKLSSTDFVLGEKKLKNLGIEPHEWFVCIHARESGYSLGKNDFEQSYRNCDVRTYDLAIDEVISRGGKCIRMGDPSMVDIEPRNGLIDYAHSPYREPFLDLYLCARAKIFLGNTSGLFAISSLFGVPVCLANMIPLTHVYPPYGSCNLGIPKLIRLNSSGRLLSFKEIFELGIANLRADGKYDTKTYSIIDNSSDEIRDLLIERLDGCPVRIDEDRKLQMQFMNIFKKYSSFEFNDQSKIGASFLKKYEELLI